MPPARLHPPATPSGDLAAWARAARPGSAGLSEEMAAFCMSGVSLHVAARHFDGRPIAGLALAARAEAGGVMRIAMRRPANRSLLEAVEGGSPVAATFSRPRDHRSIQIKAGHGDIVWPEPDDLSAAVVQSAAFRDALIEIGYAPAFAALLLAYTPAELAVLSFRPEQAFVQTPGPGAGGEITL